MRRGVDFVPSPPNIPPRPSHLSNISRSASLTGLATTLRNLTTPKSHPWVPRQRSDCKATTFAAMGTCFSLATTSSTKYSDTYLAPTFKPPPSSSSIIILWHSFNLQNNAHPSIRLYFSSSPTTCIPLLCVDFGLLLC